MDSVISRGDLGPVPDSGNVSVGMSGGIVIDGSELKSLREALCVAQWAIGEAYGEVLHDYGQRHADRLTRLLERIDEARPLGSDGKHGGLHTGVCGCEP